MSAIALEIEGRLDQSLHNAVWLTLGLERQDFQVQRPWVTTSKQPNQPLQALPSGTGVREVFEETKRQLLILGEPGSGKTTMLLELARELIDLAQEDNQQPIPVLVDLSSWKDPKQSIFEWLLGELKLKYGLRADLATEYLKQNQLLPLLDGLDEVATGKQKTCAVAINAWMSGGLEGRPCGLVVCCRREEFEMVVREPLSLYGAIYLQALTLDQITDYFDQSEWIMPDPKMLQDIALQQILTRPLFLSLFGLVLMKGKFELAIWQSISLFQNKLDYLLDMYWETSMERGLITDLAQQKSGFLSKTYGKHQSPSRIAIRRALIFLAKGIEKESSTEFSIENIQPSWLLNQRQRWSYRFLSSLLLGFPVGLITAFFGGIFGALLGLLAGALKNLNIFGTSNTVISSDILLSMFIAALGGVTAGFLIGAIAGFLMGCPMSLVGRFDKINVEKNVYTSMTLSAISQEVFLSFKFNFSSGIKLGVVGGVIGGLRLGFNGLISGLVSGILLRLLICVLFDVFKDVKKETNAPQIQLEDSQVINRLIGNIKFAIVLIISIIFPLNIVSIIYLSTMGLLSAEFFSVLVFAEFISILYVFQKTNCSAIAQHVALHLVLRHSGYAPPRYNLLLDYCAERLLLQRIGGRYRFMHKLLQDYFAAMDLE